MHRLRENSTFDISYFSEELPISYSFYLCHTIITQAFTHNALRLSIDSQWKDFLSDFGQLFLTFAATIGMATFFITLLKSLQGDFYVKS